MKREKYEPVLKNISYFIKWAEGAIVIGIVSGCIGTAFGKCVLWVSAFFQSHPWMIFLLPLSGLLVLGVYHVLGEDNNRGTNMVIESIYSNTEISFATAPAVFAGTLLTHLGGGSAGREGAALQMGGSIGTQIGKWLKFDEKDKKIAVMCGMSGVFAALFGTPMAAALARFWGLMPEQFAIGAVPTWSIETAIVAVGLAAGCALVSELFCITLHTTEHLYKKYLPSPVWRILSGAAIVIVLTLLTGSTRYNGSGVSLIEKCFEGEGLPWDFLIKILFTTVTLEAGFKGGEIVPTLTIGAAFGSFFAFLFGQPVGLMTACGMLGLFVGVTNCPISTLLLGFELFGYEAMPFFVLVIAVSFSFSGYYSLYASQKFIYSKTRTEFINRKTNK